jgi:hypothetical protein
MRCVREPNVSTKSILHYLSMKRESRSGRAIKGQIEYSEYIRLTPVMGLVRPMTQEKDVFRVFRSLVAAVAVTPLVRTRTGISPAPPTVLIDYSGGLALSTLRLIIKFD